MKREIETLLALAKQKGATAVDVIASEGTARTVSTRMGEPEKLVYRKIHGITLRIWRGGRVAENSTSDISPQSLEKLVEVTYANLEFSDDDAAHGLADPAEHPSRIPNFLLFDHEIQSCSVNDQMELALRMEDAARAYDPRITNIKASECDTGWGTIFYASSSGFFKQYRVSTMECAVAVIAAENSRMQSDYWFSSSRHRSLVEDPETIGRIAAQRALRRLGAIKVKTQEVPVVFDPLMAATLLGSIAGAASGYSIDLKSSFLCDLLGEVVASPLVTLVDDGTMRQKIGSRPFDREGARSRRTVVVENGKLVSYLLDSYSARKLGTKTTGNAGGNSSTAVSNFYLFPGEHKPEEIIASVSNGFYVTGLSGFGVNLITGDYSRGACGLWIENGELSYPVEEVTIAGNFNEMLRNIEIVGNDLVFRNEISSPTIKISRMMVAGL